MTASEIVKEAAKLPAGEVAQVVDALLAQIDAAPDPSVDAAWAAESEDRIDAFDRGEISAVDAGQALEQLKKRAGL